MEVAVRALGPLGAVLLVAFGSTWVVLGSESPWVTGLGVASGACLLGYAWGDGARLARAAQGRGVRQGAGAIVLSALALLIAGLAVVLAEEHDQTWDWTSDGRHTLADQSRTVLEALDQDVRVFAFFPADSAPNDAFQAWIERAQEHTPHLAVETIDPLRSPMLAEQYAITTENGTVVLEQGDRKQRLESDFSESAFIAALVRLGSGDTHAVCWTTGHGEAGSDDDYEARGMGAIVVKLEHHNYSVVERTVVTSGLDAACDAVVVAGPTVDWMPREREALAAYVAGGGRALVMLEPGATPELAREMARYGFDVRDDLALDVDPSFLMAQQDPSFLALYGDSFSLHPITRGLQAVVGVRGARSVQAADPAIPGLVVHSVVETSGSAWGETSWADVEGALEPDPDERTGPFGVVATVEVTDPAVLEVVRPSVVPGGVPADPASGIGTGSVEGDDGALVPADFAPKVGGRVVVTGDADFASNQLVALGNNQDLFLNAIAWLVDEEDQIGERPEPEDGQALTLTFAEEALLWLGSVILVPGAAALVAGLTAWRRRSL